MPTAVGPPIKRQTSQGMNERANKRPSHDNEWMSRAKAHTPMCLCMHVCTHMYSYVCSLFMYACLNECNFRGHTLISIAIDELSLQHTIDGSGLWCHCCYCCCCCWWWWWCFLATVETALRLLVFWPFSNRSGYALHWLLAEVLPDWQSVWQVTCHIRQHNWRHDHVARFRCQSPNGGICCLRFWAWLLRGT